MPILSIIESSIELHLTSLLRFLQALWILQDGYAVVAVDGPGEYPVVAAARAGDDCSELHLKPGTVVYITTGGGHLCSQFSSRDASGFRV